MTHGAGSTLINIRNPGRLTPADMEKKSFAHWLATARGPDSKDPNSRWCSRGRRDGRPMW